MSLDSGLVNMAIDYVQAAKIILNFQNLKKDVNVGNTELLAAAISSKELAFNYQMEQVLHEACASGNVGAVKMLIAYGVDVNHGDTSANIALHHVAVSKNMEILTMLLKAGAKINHRNGDNMTPLHMYCTKGWVGGSQRLIDAGANIHLKTRDKESALMLAAQFAFPGNEKIVSHLIEKGADTEEKSRQGYTAIELAIAKNFRKAVEVMLDCGLGIYDKSGKPYSVLHYAAEKGADDVASLMLDRGEDVNGVNPDVASYGLKTAMHYACKTDPSTFSINLIEALVMAGADLEASDITGKLPTEYLKHAWSEGYVSKIYSFAALRIAEMAQGEVDASRSRKLRGI